MRIYVFINESIGAVKKLRDRIFILVLFPSSSDYYGDKNMLKNIERIVYDNSYKYVLVLLLFLLLHRPEELVVEYSK